MMYSYTSLTIEETCKPSYLEIGELPQHAKLTVVVDEQ